MAPRTFFSFHYQNDVWRASIIRNSARLKTGITPEWIDASIWEDGKKRGDGAVKRLINNALVGTSVTCVLIGSLTSTRKFIRYEIDKSIERGNGLFGIYIHNIKAKDGKSAGKGTNPLPSGYKTYDWVINDGYTHLGTWVDAAYDAR